MKKEDMKKALPLAAFSQIPEAKADALDIVALVKKSGRVTGYELSNETFVSKEQAISMAKQGGIRGVGIAINKGNEYLKSLPDSTESNNLSNLPTVSTNKI